MSATLSAPADVKIRETECFIDGKWMPAISGKTFATINPATEQEITQVAEGDKEDVDAAEVIGVAGVERQFDSYLRDPANGAQPLQLSLDLTIQAAAERVLYGGMRLMNAKGATSILMDVHTGEVISVVSLPDFDPNQRPRPLTTGDSSDSPLFNRAVAIMEQALGLEHPNVAQTRRNEQPMMRQFLCWILGHRWREWWRGEEKGVACTRCGRER